MRIDPAALKKLLEDHNLSLADLAKRARIDKQTVWRIANGRVTTARDRTVQQIALALNVDQRVLTGERPVLPVDRENQQSSQTSQLNVRVSTETRNALYLIYERYRVRAAQVIELAPLLFCWAAEASLRKRRDQIEQVQRALENVRNIERSIDHLTGPSPGSKEWDDTIKAETEWIDQKDIFGLHLYEEVGLPNPAYGHDGDNPFAAFLRHLVEDFEEVIKFECCEWDDWPEYRVCSKEAARLVDDDSELTEEILSGNVLLYEMPKEIQDYFSPSKDRVEWVRLKADEYRKGLMDHLTRQRNKEAST